MLIVVTFLHLLRPGDLGTERGWASFVLKSRVVTNVWGELEVFSRFLDQGLGPIVSSLLRSSESKEAP